MYHTFITHVPQHLFAKLGIYYYYLKCQFNVPDMSNLSIDNRFLRIGKFVTFIHAEADFHFTP